MGCKPLPAEDLEHVLAHTRELWAEASGRSFFITGGTGFFGMWLLESFTHINYALGLGMHATVLTRDHAAFADKAPHLAKRKDLQFVQGDVRSFSYPIGTFDYVIHAATEASAKLNEQAPDEMLDAIIGGTRRVLDFAAQCGVSKLLLTSSGAVYGKQPYEMTHVPEDYVGAPDPLLPGSAYGEGKRVSEHMCIVHARKHGYEAKIARCFGFVGPHLPLDTHFAIGNFIRDAMLGERPKISGDGSTVRSYLYAADLATWLWTLLFSGPSCVAYNVGSSDHLNIRELANVVSASLGCDRSDSSQSSQLRDTSSSNSRYVPDVRKAALDLNLRPHVSLKDAIFKTANWYSNT